MVRCLNEREPDLYAESAASYDELHKEEQLRKQDLILKHFEIGPSEKLLDVGCGTGFTLERWPTKQVTGAEPSHAMIAQAPPLRQAKIIHARAEDLAIFDDREFDVVVSLTAIHNFTGVEEGLLEMRRVGKRKFAFSVLKKSAKLPGIDRLIRKHFAVKQVIDSDQHDRIYLCW